MNKFQGYNVQHGDFSSPVAQLVKNPPAIWETWVQSLGWEEPLEKGMVTHSSILSWRILYTSHSPCGCKESNTSEQLSLSLIILESWEEVLNLNTHTNSEYSEVVGMLTSWIVMFIHNGYVYENIKLYTSNIYKYCMISQ